MVYYEVAFFFKNSISILRIDDVIQISRWNPAKSHGNLSDSMIITSAVDHITHATNRFCASVSCGYVNK